MSRERTVGILVAAGSGERLGAGGPKAFVEVAGAPLLVHAARALAAATSVDALVVVVGEVERAERVLAAAGVSTRTIVEGGATRQASVAAGLRALRSADEIVAVHDAARPLVSPGLVDRTIEALVEPWAAVAPGLPVVDTVKLADGDGRVVRTLDRRGLWAVQTPQVFARDVLVGVHARLEAAAATDDLALVEQTGGRVRLVPGERLNLKVTYPEDLEVAGAIIAARERRA